MYRTTFDVHARSPSAATATSAAIPPKPSATMTPSLAAERGPLTIGELAPPPRRASESETGPRTGRLPALHR